MDATPQERLKTILAAAFYQLLVGADGTSPEPFDVRAERRRDNGEFVELHYRFRPPPDSARALAEVCADEAMRGLFDLLVDHFFNDTEARIVREVAAAGKPLKAPAIAHRLAENTVSNKLGNALAALVQRGILTAPDRSGYRLADPRFLRLLQLAHENAEG